jgi:hypothetical protein
MPPTGRPPKPIEQKRRTGNPGKRALPKAGTLAAVPAVAMEPDELDPATTFAAVLDDGRVWLARTDAVGLAILRESLEERAELRDVVLSSGSADARKALRELDKQIVGHLSTLGFDPSARARLGLAEVKAATTLEKLRRSRDG